MKNNRLIALDLFCGVGVSVGIHRAGFDVVGVDIDKPVDYPYKFIWDDAPFILSELLYDGLVGDLFLENVSWIMAGPPFRHLHEVRKLLIEIELPYIIYSRDYRETNVDLKLTAPRGNMKAYGFIMAVRMKDLLKKVCDPIFCH